MNVLFVDDEPKVLRAIERSLFLMESDWKLHFSTSASKAWPILEAEPIDVVVSDMRMPDIDGAQFLSSVRDRAPEVARVVLSGYKDESASIRSASAAHRFLAKPINGKDLIEEINSAGQMHRDESLRNVVNSISCLPSPLVTAQLLRTELRDANTTVTALAKIIATDPALCAKILQLGNSAFFGAQTVSSSVIDCLSKIGLESLRNLINSSQFIVSDVVIGGRRDEMVSRIQRHATDSADVARANTKADGDLAYLGGLLHVTGRVLYAHFGVDLSDFHDTDCCPPDGDHRDLALALLSLWGVPKAVVQAVRFHVCARTN